MTILEWIQSILGTYTPVTYQVYRCAEDTTVYYDTVVASGLAGVDWTFIFTGLFLLVVVWSAFRLIGMLMEVFRR